MTRTSLEVSGPAGSPMKIMFYLGILFVVLGAIIGLSGVAMSASLHEPEMMLFGVLFVAIFCGVGGFFAKIGHDGMHETDAVLQQGASYLGKIYDYEPDYRVTMNGQPCITLVVRYLMSGQVREARVTTGESNVANYPRGATVSIKVHDGVAALVPGSVCDLHIEQEDDLMNPDFDPSGMMSSIGASCPNCGANITVPLGMSRFCPYCNSKVSVSVDGKLQDPASK